VIPINPFTLLRRTGVIRTVEDGIAKLTIRVTYARDHIIEKLAKLLASVQVIETSNFVHLRHHSLRNLAHVGIITRLLANTQVGSIFGASWFGDV
ncbi:hypothetical protein PMAYCL1PPCAC_21259, partial [Pristionchus mayeri]